MSKPSLQIDCHATQTHLIAPSPSNAATSNHSLRYLDTARPTALLQRKSSRLYVDGGRRGFSPSSRLNSHRTSTSSDTVFARKQGSPKAPLGSGTSISGSPKSFRSSNSPAAFGPDGRRGVPNSSRRLNGSPFTAASFASRVGGGNSSPSNSSSPEGPTGHLSSSSFNLSSPSAGPVAGRSAASTTFPNSPSGSVAGTAGSSSGKAHCDGLVKLLLLGDSAVGKSSLMTRFCDDRFEPTHILTIGVDFKTRIKICGDERLRLQIWDTAGQERFRNITPVYFRNASGIVLVYDIANAETFRNIRFWMKNLEEFAEEGIPRILVGNKIDLAKREVSQIEGAALAADYGIPFYETSAKLNVNVSEVFTQIAIDVRKHQKSSTWKQQGPKSQITLGGEAPARSASYLYGCCAGGGSLGSPIASGGAATS